MKRLALALVALLVFVPVSFAATCNYNFDQPVCFNKGSVTFASGVTVDMTSATVSMGASGLTADSVDGTQLADIIGLDTTVLGIKNISTGAVTFNFHDYADTTDDDMAHVTLEVNCTDTSTGAEDCDLVVKVVEAGAAAETRFTIDADGGITLGSANNNSVTLTTDSTGDGEVVLPTGSVSASEILDLTRYENISIFSMVECTTDAGALIGFDTTADALPDFACSATDGLGCSLTFDAVGGSADTAKACGAFVVPADYVSGGAFIFRATKSAETGANSEVINVQISNDGAALEVAGTATTSGTAAATYTVTPTIAGLTAGESVGFAVSVTSSGTADDAVNILSIGFSYTASE